MAYKTLLSGCHGDTCFFYRTYVLLGQNIFPIELHYLQICAHWQKRSSFIFFVTISQTPETELDWSHLFESDTNNFL